MGFAIKFYLFYSTPTLPTSALKKKKISSSKPLLESKLKSIVFSEFLTLLTLILQLFYLACSISGFLFKVWGRKYDPEK